MYSGAPPVRQVPDWHCQPFPSNYRGTRTFLLPMPIVLSNRNLENKAEARSMSTQAAKLAYGCDTFCCHLSVVEKRGQKEVCSHASDLPRVHDRFRQLCALFPYSAHLVHDKQELTLNAAGVGWLRDSTVQYNVSSSLRRASCIPLLE